MTAPHLSKAGQQRLLARDERAADLATLRALLQGTDPEATIGVKASVLQALLIDADNATATHSALTFMVAETDKLRAEVGRLAGMLIVAGVSPVTGGRIVQATTEPATAIKKKDATP